MYFLCYIDRINVSFAALTMNKDIGLTAATYGFSATAFYIGYVVFEIPSNLIMDKVGARLWLARIMVTWGIASAATAAVIGPTHSCWCASFWAPARPGCSPESSCCSPMVPGFASRADHRFLFPGATRFRGARRPHLNRHSGHGRRAGHQRLAVDLSSGSHSHGTIGFYVLVAMTDNPAKAKWLTDPERNWLTNTLTHERSAVEAGGTFSILRGIANPKVLLLSFNYLGIVTASLGLLLFAPQIIKSLGSGSTNMAAGYATSLAYFCGAASMMLFGWLSDRLGDRRWLLFLTCAMATVGLVVAGATMGTWWSLVGMCLATAGSTAQRDRSGPCRR